MPLIDVCFNKSESVESYTLMTRNVLGKSAAMVGSTSQKLPQLVKARWLVALFMSTDRLVELRTYQLCLQLRVSSIGFE